MRRPQGAKGAKAWRYVITGLIAAVPGITAILTDNVTLGLITAGIVLAAILIGPWADRLLIGDDAPSG